MSNTTYLSAYVPDEMAKAVKEHAKRHGVAISDVVRGALERFFKDESEAERIEWIANDIKAKVEEGTKRILKELGQFDIK